VWGFTLKDFEWLTQFCLLQRGGAFFNTAVTKVFLLRCSSNCCQAFSDLDRLVWPDLGWHFSASVEKWKLYWIKISFKTVYVVIGCEAKRSIVHDFWMQCRYVAYNRWSGCPFMLSPPVRVWGSLMQPFVCVFLPQGWKHFLMLHETRTEC